MKTKHEISNYEKMKNSAAETFLQYNQQDMIQKFGLAHDEKYLYLYCLNRKYRINRQNGQVSWSGDGFQTEEMADYNETMTIYDVLCWSKENCHLAHEWVNVGSLSSVRGGTLANSGYFCVLLISLPKVYPNPKQVKPKLITAMRSTILIWLSPLKVCDV